MFKTNSTSLYSSSVNPSEAVYSLFLYIVDFPTSFKRVSGRGKLKQQRFDDLQVDLTEGYVVLNMLVNVKTLQPFSLHKNVFQN